MPLSYGVAFFCFRHGKDGEIRCCANARCCRVFTLCKTAYAEPIQHRRHMGDGVASEIKKLKY